MKKILRILLIILGVFLVLMVTVPILFRSRIESKVKEEINKQVHARVDWSGIGISLFRGFPDLSINLREFYVLGLDDFEGDTLAGMERFEIRVDLISAIRKDVEVESIILDRPLINAVVLEDGSASWDIAREPGEEAGRERKEPGETLTGEAQQPSELAGEEPRKTAAEKPAAVGGQKEIPVRIRLNRLAILDGRLVYGDAVSGAEAMVQDLDLELSGDFSMDQTDVDLAITAGGIHAVYGGIHYLKDAVFGLDLTAAADMVHNIYTLKQNEIRLNELVMGTEGVVSLKEEGAMDMDLRFFSRRTSFESLLSMVPAIYLREFSTLKTGGNLQLEGTVKGIMKDTILPDATLDLVVSDGYFAYPELPKEVTDVQIELHADYRGTDMDRSTVDLKKFHLLLGGNPIDLSLRVANPVSDMLVEGLARGVVDFSTLRDVVPLEDIELRGRLETDLRWDTRMSYIENEQYEKVDVDGRLLVESVLLNTPEIPVPVQLNRMDMDFTPRVVNLVALDLHMGGSDLVMNGKLTNFIPYIFADQTVSGSLNVTSNLLDVNELLPGQERDTAMEQLSGQEPLPGGPAALDTTGQQPLADAEMTASEITGDSLAEPAAVKIPENLNFHMTLDMKKVAYQDIMVEHIKGAMQVTGGTARLDQLQMDILDGSVHTSGVVDTRGAYTVVDVDLDIRKVDIPSAYATFITVKRLAPMARYCKGTANVDMKYRSLLDAKFTPLFSTIDAKGRVFTRGLQFYNTRSFIRLSELLKNEKFRNMAPDEVDLRFTILAGRVMVDPFDMDFDHSKITVSGSHGIDGTMDYLLDMHIAKTDLGEGAAEMMQGITALAAGAGLQIPQSDVVKVKARIRGTFRDPRITTDLSENLRSGGEAVKTAVEEKVQEKLEQVEEDVRKEAGERAEQIISEAEKEAIQLIEEAQKAGDQLVKEAELQGEKLVREAGSNPLKKAAARKAAEELKKQAVKQSENLVREAEEKADRIVQQAREEAEKL
jgi:hypothetical protein